MFGKGNRTVDGAANRDSRNAPHFMMARLINARRWLIPLMRLPLQPWNLAVLARNSRTSHAAFGFILGFEALFLIPLAAVAAGANEPYRDMSAYFFEVAVAIPTVHVILVFVYAIFHLALVVPALFAERSGRVRLAARLRVILLTPLALLIPGAVWTLARIWTMPESGGVGLFWYDQHGIPYPNRQQAVQFFGQWYWWPCGLLFACLLAALASHSLGGLPQYARHPFCRECGYDLTGNTSGRCPECGTISTVSLKVR